MKFKLIILFLLATSGLQAQTLLTLEQYRERVIVYNQQLKGARESTIAAEAKRNVVRVGFLPKLDASGQYAYSSKIDMPIPGFNMKQDNYNLKAEVVQPIYTGGALTAQYKAAKLEKEIAIYNEEYTLDQVVYNADMVYWTAAAHRQFLENTQQYHGTVSELFSIIQKRFDDGLISRTDLLQVQTRLKEAEQQLISSQLNSEVAHQNLNIMMGEPADLDYRTAEGIEKQNTIPQQTDLESVLLLRPDFEIARKQVSLSEQQSKAAVAKFNPQLAIGGNGSWGTKSFNIDGSTQWLASGFASLSIPVFHWGERRYTKSMTMAAVRIKKYEMELQRDNIQRELSTAWSQIKAQTEQLKVANENLNISAESLDLNTFSYNEGKLPIVDVLSSQLAWVQAFTSYINTNYGLKTSIAEYQRITSTNSILR